MGPEALLAALARPARPSSDYDLNPGQSGPLGRVLRPAAVLVGVQGDRVILTKRSSHLAHHPGQIAFPGGKIDAGDTGPEGAALREAAEEIGLPKSAVTLIGRLPDHETVTGFRITPILAHVADFAPVAEPGEVDEVFTVPLSWLGDPENYRVEGRLWRGTFRNFYAAPWGPYYIWGATARILRGLADRL